MEARQKCPLCRLREAVAAGARKLASCRLHPLHYGFSARLVLPRDIEVLGHTDAAFFLAEKLCKAKYFAQISAGRAKTPPLQLRIDLSVGRGTGEGSECTSS